MRLRLVSYNVSSFRAGVDPIRAVIEPVVPDLLMLQDCGSRRHLLQLAGALEMESMSSYRAFHTYRHAVLFRPQWRLVSGSVHRLSTTGGATQRGFVLASLRRTGVRLGAISARLGLSAGQREAHARELTDFVAGMDVPVVLGVDMNEPEDGAPTRWIAARMFDAFTVAGGSDGNTFPSSAPSVRMDHVFATEGVTVERAWTPDGSAQDHASDHRPVVAEAEIDEG